MSKITTYSEITALIGGQTSVNTIMCSQAQYDYYVTLCNQKGMTAVDKSELTSAEISNRIKSLKELKKTYPISAGQVSYIKNLCESLKMKEPEMTGWSSEKGKEFISLLQKKMPATPSQIDALINCMRCGLISEVKQKISMYEASQLLETNKEEADKLSSGRCTIAQYKLICRLNIKLGSPEMDLYESLSMSYETASELIGQLSVEVANAGDMKFEQEGTDNSRNIEVEKKDKLSVEEMTQAQKEDIIRKLYAELNMQLEDNISNINDVLNDTVELAILYGISKEKIFSLAAEADSKITRRSRNRN